ncbi:RAD52 motif-containing protein 1 [Elysia marginata]|uniref:RAD52 motif-containing protein 1 n=1 Tax=Elysia marginata TaxID=1093978 RepID=A0AAV4IDB0_9GAST|nr:RAD52 motif-containing protein 1 [Elysia marginata]
MTSPVVRSGFGSRPLLEVPAMDMMGTSQIAVNSLMASGAQRTAAVDLVPEARAVIIGPTSIVAAPTVQAAPAAAMPAPTVPGPYNQAPLNPFPAAMNPMTGPGLYNMQPTSFSAGGYPANFPGSFPAAPQPFPTFDGRHHSAPQGPFYNSQGRLYYYGPNGEIIFPPQAYAGVANPFTGAVPNQYTPPQGFHPFGGQPDRMAYPGHEPRPFSVTCELEYGRITNIDLKDSIGTFRGIPDFIRLELLRTYGAQAFTEVKIKYSEGEFHIYASNEKWPKNKRSMSRDSPSEGASSDGDYGETDVDSYAHIKPRRRGERPRRIVHTKGWNRFR